MRPIVIVLAALVVGDAIASIAEGQLFRRRRCNVKVNRVAFVEAVAVPVQTAPIVIQNNYPAPLAAQGGTVYGYNQVSSGYNPFSVDPAAILRDAARLAEGQQEVTREFMGVYEKVSTDALRLSAINDQLRARAELIESTNPNQSTSTLTTNQTITLTPDGRGNFSLSVGQQQPQQQQPSLTEPHGVKFDASEGLSVMENKCAACHTGSGSEGGFMMFLDSGEPATLDAEARKKIIAETNLGTMPKKPAEPLTAEEFIAIREHLFPTQK